MLGMFPGISMPPDISRPYRAALIWLWLIAGEISAAVRVALSRIAETMFTQKRTIVGNLGEVLEYENLHSRPQQEESRHEEPDLARSDENVPQAALIRDLLDLYL